MFNPTEVDMEICRLQGKLSDLLRDLSAIEDETGVDFFDTEDDNYKNVMRFHCWCCRHTIVAAWQKPTEGKKHETTSRFS